MTGVREQLRRETRAAHDRVDAAFARFDLRSREGYGGFLQAHGAVLPSLEAAAEAAGAGALLPDWAERRRTAVLLDDLNRLGLHGTAGAIDPAPDTQAGLLGLLYVLEGSRLGARLLLREVRTAEDPAVREATAYLAHGEGRRFWPDFLRVLESEQKHADLVLGGAVTAFAAFEQAAQERS